MNARTGELFYMGNQAVHSHRAVPAADALVAVRELFHLCFWLALP